MVFRLGGFGLLCIVALFILRDAHPFYGVALLVAYLAFSILLIRGARRTANANSPPIRLGKWPTDRSYHRVVGVCLAVVFIAFYLLMAAAHSVEHKTMFLAAALLSSGMLVVLMPLTALRFGFFPDSIAGQLGFAQGFSKEDDPLQFWITLAIWTAIGTALLIAGITRAISVIHW